MSDAPVPVSAPPWSVAYRRFQPALAAITAVGIWVLLVVLFFGGLEGADDLEYLRYAFFWDRPPANHWEARLPCNLLLRGSLLLFGFSQGSAAVPGLLGGLLLLLAPMYTYWRFRRAVPAGLLAALILATMPATVMCTTPNARLLAAGLLAVGLALVLTSHRPWAVLAGGGFLGLSIATHLSMAFFAAAFLASVAIVWTGRRRVCLQAAAAAAVVYLAADPLVYWLWTGDPFYPFKIIAHTHLAPLVQDDHARRIWSPEGSLNWWFFWQPIQRILVSPEFGLVGAAAVVTVLAGWRQLSRLARTMAVFAMLSWLWMSYGTQVPWRYVPFPGISTYWMPLAFPLAILSAEGLRRLPRRSLVAFGMVLLVGVNVLILGSHGTWGQSMTISQSLLDYARAHGDTTFVTDDQTLTEMTVLNAFDPIPNVLAAPISTTPRFTNAAAAPRDKLDGMLLLVNVLNDHENRNHTFDWVVAHRGPEVFATPTRYRSTTYVLPRRYRTTHPWTVRTPPACVCLLACDRPEPSSIARQALP